MIKRNLAGVYGPNLKCTKPADCLTDCSANQTHLTRGLMILYAHDVTLTVDFINLICNGQIESTIQNSGTGFSSLFPFVTAGPAD